MAIVLVPAWSDGGLDQGDSETGPPDCYKDLCLIEAL